MKLLLLTQQEPKLESMVQRQALTPEEVQRKCLPNMSTEKVINLRLRSPYPFVQSSPGY